MQARKEEAAQKEKDSKAAQALISKLSASLDDLKERKAALTQKAKELKIAAKEVAKDNTTAIRTASKALALLGKLENDAETKVHMAD